uniref:DDE Tnp4 domain-containing protein n=1 Tax=Leptobrachium leishanense TaxID=445787 RepID=A0A8C5R7Y7_9ANUR
MLWRGVCCKMDGRDAVLFTLLAYAYSQKLKKKRKWWVHPINSLRDTHGHFHTLYKSLREGDLVKFFNYLRMSIVSFDELLASVKKPLTKMDTKMRGAISPEEMLVITLRYLACGCSLQDLHFNFRIGRTTAGKVVRKVCQTIWDTLKEKCIPTPNESTWADIVEGFQDRANFPNCLGAVDGKHIHVVKPELSGSQYMNYKHFFSIGLLAVADANYRFTYVEIGSYGKDSDSTVFQNSTLWQQIRSNSLNIPKPKMLPGTDIAVPFAFVGDEAFALSTKLLRPYGGRQLSEKKRIFNYRLSRARRYVECSFGILSNKWRILHRPLDVNVDFAVDIVKCCCVLHNFIRDHDGYNFRDSLSILGLKDHDDTDRCPVNSKLFLYCQRTSAMAAWENLKCQTLFSLFVSTFFPHFC